MCNTSFHGILSEKSIYGIILLIQGHFQSWKGHFQGQQDYISPGAPAPN